MLILFEDEHLLVINKPSGVNTHKPDRFAPDGIHEWLTHRESRWAKLSILHRLDKDTSGVLVFGKTTKANQSLTQQFTAHTIKKEYLLLTATKPTRIKFVAKSPNARTTFEFVQPHGDVFLVRAQPITGKTHQIRQHAADNAFPILGDTEYGGAPAPRLMLHAHTINFVHPGTGERVTFEASVPRAFDESDALVCAQEFRELLFGELWEPASAGESGRAQKGAPTDCYRLISDAADGLPGVIVDWYDGHALVQWQTEKVASELYEKLPARSIYEQIVTKQKRTTPRLVAGKAADRFEIRENGVTYLVNFGEGLSTGLFLDQRENRRRLLTMGLAGKTVLNCFAYTCAFSVAAAKVGATTTSVDLSRNYLDWGRDNFRANNLDPAAHEFVFGDVFEWLKRFAKRGRTWDVVLLDPPTFSTTKRGRAFRAERDYAELNALAMSLVARGGWLFCSTNQRSLRADEFETMLRNAAKQCGRAIEELEYRTLPFDFRVPARERPYLKTFWARLT